MTFGQCVPIYTARGVEANTILMLQTLFHTDDDGDRWHEVTDARVVTVPASVFETLNVRNPPYSP
jgi:hypothetical protein